MSTKSDRATLLETGEYDALEINQTFFYTVVCHRTEIEPQDAIERATMPPGTSNGWQFVERADLPESWWEGEGAYDGTDTPYPQPCNDHPETHVHSVGAC